MKPLILVIEDSKAIRFLLQTILGDKYQVVTAPDAASAMYFLGKKNFPALIIADPKLQDSAKWSLVEHLSFSGMYGHIPLMVLTDAEHEEVKLKCSECGVSKYFRKPFNPVLLIEAVQELTSGDIAASNRSLNLA